MSGRAIVSLLLAGGQEALCRYVHETGVTVLTRTDCCGESARKVIENAGGKAVMLDELLTAEDVSRIRLIAHSKAEQIAKALQGGTLEREAAECNVDARTAKDWLIHAMPSHIERVLTLVEQLEKARSQYSIELTILSEEWTEAGRVVLRWSRQNNIPVLHVTHGVGLSRYYTVHSTLEADKYAVFGERGMESLLDEGVSRERIVAVGNPLWDSYPVLAARRAELRAHLCDKCGLDASRPIIVFGTTWNAYLSAFDQRSYVRDLEYIFRAFTRLAAFGCAGAQLVVKDRIAHGNEVQLFQEAVARAGLPFTQVVHTAENPKEWVVSADVLVSVDSNMAVECVLAGTPAVNLIDETGLLLGPSFAADGAILEALPGNLAEVLASLLNDTEVRRLQYEAMRRKAPAYNIGVDGQSVARLTELIKTMVPNSSGVADVPVPYVWQTVLHAEETDATQYHNWPRSELVDIAPRAMRMVLDIGCAAGKTGEYVKQKFPQAKVYGVELNPTAAELAATRLDSVFAGRFEDFDFAAHGIAPGSLDTIIVADVLEHIYDPWDVLVRLRPYLTPDAQVVASIPNTRNLALMNGLAEGAWRYEAWGLLDVTHIRFFTLKEIRRFFHETGYHVVRVHNNLDTRLAGLYQEHRGKPLINVDFDKFTLKNVAQEELAELCTIQFFVVAEPGALQDEAFLAQEKIQTAAVENRTAYSLWREARQLAKTQGSLYEQRMAAWPAQPTFHLVIVANPVDEARLGASIQSLAGQYYHNLQLTVVSVSPPPQGWTDSDRLAWRHTPENGLIKAANGALCVSGADWVGMIDAGDTVAPYSFLFLAEAVNAHPDWRFVYTDEDVLADGKHESPHFKPDFNPDLLRSMAYSGGLALVARALFKRLDGFSTTLRGAEDYDLALRTYEMVGPAAIGHLPEMLYHRLKDGGRWRLPAAEVVEVGKRAVELHLSRCEAHGAVEHGLFPGSYRVRYALSAKPRVSILIAVRDGLDSLQRCIESVLATTSYPDYEVLIIDNDSTFPETRAYLEGLETLGDERIRVYTHPAAASLPLLHNLLAGEARGEYLLFLHFDAAILQDDWLDSMMAHGMRPEVGLVAPRLLRMDGSVAQAGLVLGLGKTVDTPFQGAAMDHAGYFGRAHLEQNFSAVGGGCLLVRKALFLQAGGFDAENFARGFAEADLSQRIIALGSLVIWTPFVNVLCEGNAPQHILRDDATGEDAAPAMDEAAEHLYEKWLPQLARDPAYNVNLSLERGKSFELETRTVLNWDPLPWRPLPRVLAQPADIQGCGEYRIISPMRALVDAGRVQGWADFNLFSVPEMARLDVDAIILQRQTLPEQIKAIARHKKFSRALRVYELDDLLIKMPVKSIHSTDMPKDINKRLRQAVALCDRFVVSTEPLKEAYKDYHPDIRVVPNYLERARWGGLKPLRRQSARPRVGWAGGIGHTGDLEMIVDVVQALAEEVDWVFMGMCPDNLRPWIKEFHPGVPVGQYPAKLASLNLDLAIAPLEQNPFNESKSHLRLLEYGILGYPVVCSDVYPYQGDFSVVRVRNRHKEWVDAILAQISDLDKCASAGDRLRKEVGAKWMLEDNLDAWLSAWLP